MRAIGRRPSGSTGTTAPPPAGRFLSAAECQALFTRIRGFTTGVDDMNVSLASTWQGTLGWARNGIISSGDVRVNTVSFSRWIGGVQTGATTNVLDDRHLRWAIARGERASGLWHEVPEALRSEPSFVEADYPKPTLWYDSTYHQDAAQRAELMQRLVQSAQAAGMLAAGDIEVAAAGRSVMDAERVWYYPFTTAQYSVTVRTPDGSGSGWAGMDHNDWAKIDAVKLTQVALEKCLRSRTPVRLEPGRYTTILEPQAAGDFVQLLASPASLNRARNEDGDPQLLKTDPRYKPNPTWVYNDGPGYSKLGEQVIDARLTLRTDCLDPDTGFVPFGSGFEVYHPVTWIEDGILKELAYGTGYAVQKLHRNTGGVLANGVFRMNVKGETVSVEEMIATTQRGLLVTRFARVRSVSEPNTVASGLLTGYTRDGVWLIERGKLSKAVKNFRFTESPLFALNNVEQVGVPQRIFSPGCPIVVPALKVRDFSFTGLSDAV